MLRQGIVAIAATTLCGCEVMSETPLLEASEPLTLDTTFYQRMDATDGTAEFLILEVRPNGQSLFVEAYRVAEDGTVTPEDPGLLFQFYDWPEQPDFLIVESSPTEDWPDPEDALSRGYGVVFCDGENILQILDLDISSDLYADDPSVSKDEWGTITVATRQSLMRILDGVIDRQDYSVLDGTGLPSLVVCDDLFADAA